VPKLLAESGLDVRTQALHEYRLTLELCQQLMRAFIGAGVNGYEPSAGGSVVEALIATVSPRPAPWARELEAEFHRVAGLGVNTEPVARARAAAGLLDLLLQKLRDTWGRDTVARLYENFLKWTLPVWGYSDAQIQARILSSRAAERKLFRERLGAMSDSQRATVQNLMALGLYDVLTEADREELGEATDQPHKSLVSRIGPDDDNYRDDQLVDRGDYGDLGNRDRDAE
jgi:hypothetical protein